MIPIEDLTDVTLAIEDTDEDYVDDEDDEDDEDGEDEDHKEDDDDEGEDEDSSITWYPVCTCQSQLLP